jgi:hypothetical protein
MVSDIATKLQPSIPCITRYLAADYDVDGLNGLFLANFQGFSRLLNANNSETTQTNRFKLRLLRGLPRIYDPAQFELFRSNRKIEFIIKTVVDMTLLRRLVRRPLMTLLAGCRLLLSTPSVRVDNWSDDSAVKMGEPTV